MIRENKTVMPLVGKRIFNIEDDVKNRSVVKTILEYAGALVASESWGRIEIVFARLEIFLPVDLILLDLMFPKNG
jgi:CheY-like chemotaxis protein